MKRFLILHCGAIWIYDDLKMGLGAGNEAGSGLCSGKKSASEGLDLGGEIEVLVGEAAGVVGGEGEVDAVIADIDVGVVASLFRELPEAVDEVQRGEEVRELKGSDEMVGLDLPAGEGGESGLGLLG